MINRSRRYRVIVVYCASGYRSSVAAALLRREGLPDVSDLLGGYRAWTHSPNPSLDRPTGQLRSDAPSTAEF
jgi:rhodanese-related sulfurtransferase